MAKNPNLKINLSELFGDRIRTDEETKIDIGRRIIEAIQNRTFSGKDMNGENFKTLSKEYAKRVGKNEADLYLTGSMLDSMDIISIKGNDLVIGWEKNSTNWLKAQNHQFGVTLPKRSFMGLTDEDKEEIKDQYEDV